MYFRLHKLLLLSGAILLLSACQSVKEIQNPLPGQYSDYTLLPNGWKLTPSGKVQIPIGELPLNMLVTDDEHYAITSNSGTGKQTLSVIDLDSAKEVQRLKIDKTWRGLAFNKEQTKVFVSGANNNAVNIYDFFAGRLHLSASVALDSLAHEKKISVTGLDYWAKKNVLLVVSKESNTLYALDLSANKLIKKIAFTHKCFDVKINHAENRAYVSLWGGAAVAVIALPELQVLTEIKTGDHPCEMLITPDDQRLFVTNANNNSTSALDLQRNKEIERIHSALGANLPFGSTPDALALDAKRHILFVANADNNDLALFDVSESGQSKSLGFIPVAWYPTAVRFLSKKKTILVANGKGLASQANPLGPKPGRPHKKGVDQYIGRLFKGTVSLIDLPSPPQLSRYSKQVFANTPYYYKKKNWLHRQNIIPEKHNGRRSQAIRYVFYIIKENRTYDQVLGDLKQGNGDSSLCIFGEAITPNTHRLAQSFTLFDNFYADAEVSADGHNWSTAAYATDYVEKTWPTLYGRRGGGYDYEGGVPVAAPSSGYIWDQVLKKDLSLRDYGEFAWHDKQHKGFYKANDRRMQPYLCTAYPCFDLSIKDTTRFRIWKKDFERLLKNDSVPAFNLIRLPNNHTAGTMKGLPTVQAMVADNDYALGLFVQIISHSKIWKNSIVFVVEDDAQNGSDHVDAHRSLLQVFSPYIKRGFVDHTMYSTSSVLKTIELVLGLPAMTQYDLSATPILFAVRNQPDLTPYTAVKPQVNLDEMNNGSAYGAQRCSEMNLAVEDAIPDIEFNEIIWKAVKGRNAVMPPPVRSAFVHAAVNDD